METLYEVSNLPLTNRTINFVTVNNPILTNGSFIMFRLRVLSISPNSSITIIMNVTFPSGNTKRFELVANEVGSYQRGGWAGEDRNGQISASGSILVVGSVTIDASIVTYEKGEDVPEWS